jgi:hypothetical protein
MKRLFILISLLLIPNTTLAISLGDLKKTLENATEEIKKEIETPKEQNTDTTTEQKSKKESQSEKETEKKKTSSENKIQSVSGQTDLKITAENSRFIRKLYFCPRNSNTNFITHFIYNPKKNDLPDYRCLNYENYLDFNEAKIKQSLEWCYAVRKQLDPPEIGWYILDKETNKKICSPIWKYREESDFNNPFIGSGPIKVDFKSGFFDIRDIIEQQKNEPEETIHDRYVSREYKLNVVFGLISKEQYNMDVTMDEKLKEKEEVEKAQREKINSLETSYGKFCVDSNSNKGTSEYEKCLSESEVLVASYLNYQILTKLYNSRKNYAIQYVTSEQLAEVKEKLKFIEKQIVQKHNIKDKDQVWEEAAQIYNKEYHLVDRIEASGEFYDSGKELSTLSLNGIFSAYQDMGGSTNVKKNF